MTLNKKILILALNTAMLMGCADKETKSLLGEELVKGIDDVSTRGYSNDPALSGEQFGVNSNDSVSGSRNGFLGAEFNDPANPLSKHTIYFRYNSSEIKQEYIAVVAAHAQYLRDHPMQRITLEGHADERGSREYNIALGEQRAKSVYRIMKMQGVEDNGVVIVSYGEEKPNSEGMDEGSWQMNRRVELVYQGQ